MSEHTEHEQTPEQSEAEYAAKYDALRETAVKALTAVARLRHPRCGQADFADLLANVCSAAAANVGSVGRLLGGRSGSWEADLVAQLVNGTVGWEGEYLLQHRTEPIVIHLNVDRLLVERVTGPDYATDYEREVNVCHIRWDEMSDHESDVQPADTYDQELAGIETRWTARYAAFADAFTAAVQAEVAGIEGLHVPVMVEAVTAPGAVEDSPSHPSMWDDCDPIVWRLWEHAISTVPLPGEDPSGEPDGPR